MLSQKEKLNNIQELKNDILQRIANNDSVPKSSDFRIS